MLLIKKNVDLNILLNYGFKLDPHREYYYKEIDEDVEIQVQIRDKDYFKEREVILYSQTGIYLNSLETLYYLIEDGLIEVRV